MPERNDTTSTTGWSNYSVPIIMPSFVSQSHLVVDALRRYQHPFIGRCSECGGATVRKFDAERGRRTVKCLTCMNEENGCEGMALSLLLHRIAETPTISPSSPFSCSVCGWIHGSQSDNEVTHCRCGIYLYKGRAIDISDYKGALFICPTEGCNEVNVVAHIGQAFNCKRCGGELVTNSPESIYYLNYRNNYMESGSMAKKESKESKKSEVDVIKARTANADFYHSYIRLKQNLNTMMSKAQEVNGVMRNPSSDNDFSHQFKSYCEGVIKYMDNYEALFKDAIERGK